jgi:histo-blood group ABO system transferase
MNRVSAVAVFITAAALAGVLLIRHAPVPPTPLRVAFITLATRRPYFDMAISWAESLDRHFCPGQRASIQPTFVIFTDQEGDGMILLPGTLLIPTKRLPWPDTTLMRFEIMLSAWNETLQGFDYLYWMDADTLAVADFCYDILGERVALSHTWFPAGRKAPFEDNYQSTAFVPRQEADIQLYFSAHLYGGSRDRFEHLLRSCADTVATDRANYITALVHDESYLNRYMIFHPPTLILTHSFTCFPQEAYDQPGLIPTPLRIFSRRFGCIIQALWKNNTVRGSV